MDSNIIGKVVEGKVIGFADFGAFVRLPGGGKGLIHISNIKEGFVNDISEHLKIGDFVKVRVLSKDKKGNFNFSMKEVNDSPLEIAPKPNPSGFEEKLALFLRESEERLSDLKRNIEAKRGERRK